MHGVLGEPPVTSRKATVDSDSELGVGCDSDESDWFGSVARELLGKDAGFALHLLTGAPEGSCYKYTTKRASSRRQPSAFILRQVIRSDHGWQFLSAIMEGSGAEWWSDLQLARKLVEVVAAHK